MYCAHCDYQLIGLPEHRCPECGNIFDPNDRSTFCAVPEAHRRMLRFRRVTILVVCVGALICTAGIIYRHPLLMIVFVFWCAHVVAAFLLGLPFALLGRRFIHWNECDVLGLFLPFVAWATLFVSNEDKGMSDLPVCLAISVTTPLYVILRVLLDHRRPQWLWSLVLVSFLCAFAAVLAL
jgi:hypothetical protein